MPINARPVATNGGDLASRSQLLRDALDASRTYVGTLGTPTSPSTGLSFSWMRLAILHKERRAEEAIGRVQWLRPDYQVPRFAPEQPVEQTTALPMGGDVSPEQLEPMDWPSTAIDQIGAVKAAVLEAPGNVEEIASRFRNARRAMVEMHLGTLNILAEIRRTDDGRFH